MKQRLRARSINTSVSARDDAVIDMDEKRVTSVLRFSPHYYNTEEELETAALTLQEELTEGRARGVNTKSGPRA